MNTYNEQFKMTGIWDFYLTEGTPLTLKELAAIKSGGEISREYRKITYKNIIPTVSRQQIAKALAGSITLAAEIKVNFQELGTGTNAPANGDTGLQTATGSTRKALSSAGFSANQLNLTSFWAVGEATGTWREFGSFINGTSTSNSGVLFNRVAINITVTGADALTIDGTITLT